MSSRFSRPACLALLFGLIALGGSAAEAGNINVNLNTRISQNLTQTVFAGGRHTHVGPTAVPAPSYGGLGYHHRSHIYDRNTQFDGMGDSSATTKLPK